MSALGQKQPLAITCRPTEFQLIHSQIQPPNGKLLELGDYQGAIKTLMRSVVLMFCFFAIPLAFGEPLFLPTTEADRSRLPLDHIRFLDRNEYAIPDSVNIYRVNMNAFAETTAVMTIQRGSGKAPLRIRINRTKHVRSSFETQEFSGELLHPNSDETTPISLWLHAWRVDSFGHLPYFDQPDQEFVYSLSASIPIRWETTILQIRTISQSPDMVILYDVEPNQTTRDMEEFNAYVRELLRKNAKSQE